MQSRTHSLIESVANTMSGFVLSFCVWQAIGPWFGYDVNVHDNLLITGIFTVVSVIRSYVWRRIFNNRSAST